MSGTGAAAAAREGAGDGGAAGARTSAAVSKTQPSAEGGAALADVALEVKAGELPGKPTSVGVDELPKSGGCCAVQ